MFLVELANGNLLFGLIPESGALLLCGISLIGGALVVRKFFKYKDDEEIIRQAENIKPEIED